jgi:excisionase family DNA binding protein
VHELRRIKKALSVGRTTLYALMGRGDLAFVYAGGCRRIPLVAVHRFIEREMQRQGFQS